MHFPLSTEVTADERRTLEGWEEGVGEDAERESKEQVAWVLVSQWDARIMRGKVKWVASLTMAGVDGLPPAVMWTLSCGGHHFGISSAGSVI